MALPIAPLFLFLLLGSMTPVMADDERKDLEVRLTQSGFAGESGSLWTIEPSGRWSRQEIAGGEVQPVEGQSTGVLDSRQMDRLLEVLRQNDFETLPDKVGSNARANPRRLTISWGEKRVEIVTSAGVDPTAAPPAESSDGERPESRAAAIARTVQELTEP